MIHDLTDLEPILRQYDPGKILVGPLGHLWTNSSFRVFNIAGNGGKIHETIGLGFVKVETDAQRRRTDIVAVLQSRFGEVQIFDCQLEMARAAHTLWANDETARFLATATLESKLQPTRKVDQDQGLNDASKSSVLPSDRDKEFVDEAAGGSVAPDAASAHAPLSAPDQAQPTPACHPAQTDEPLDLPNAHVRLPLDCDPLTFAVVRLKSSTDGIATTEAAAETDANTQTAAETDANTKTIAEPEANTETAAETVANTETVETVANTETAVETVANTETIAETEANTFDARIAKPKRRSRRPRRGSAAGAGGAASAAAVANTETIAETAANTETAAETDANTQPVFEHSDQMPVKKQSQSEPASDGFLACGDDYALRHRAVRADLILRPPTGVPQWPIVERIGILCLMVVAVASVIVLLFSYEESLHDSVLPLPTSLDWRSDTLVAKKFPAIGSAMVDDESAAAAAAPLRPESLSEIPTESHRPPPRALIPPNQAALNAEPPIPLARDPLSATAAPIAVPQSAAPAPSDPAVRLDNDETTRLIERGQDFLNAGDFASARLLFKRAADAGSAEAALALGSTYDPSVIKQLGAVSVTADLDRALKWYETAADRGSPDAAARYANLMQAR
jgi:hypothetical protein